MQVELRGWESIPVEMFKNKVTGEVMIIGKPLPEPREDRDIHNCDQMGCGTLDHVIYRGPMPCGWNPTPESENDYRHENLNEFLWHQEIQYRPDLCWFDLGEGYSVDFNQVNGGDWLCIVTAKIEEVGRTRIVLVGEPKTTRTAAFFSALENAAARGRAHLPAQPMASLWSLAITLAAAMVMECGAKTWSDENKELVYSGWRQVNRPVEKAGE